MCVSVDGWGQQVPFSPALSLQVARLPQQVGWGCKGLTQSCSRAQLIRNFQEKTIQWKNGESPLTLLLVIHDFCSLSTYAFIWCPSLYSELCTPFSQRLAWLCLIAKADQLTKELSKVEIGKPVILMKAQCGKEGLPKPLLWIFWNQVPTTTTFSYPLPPLQIIINSVIRTLNHSNYDMIQALSSGLLCPIIFWSDISTLRIKLHLTKKLDGVHIPFCINA